MIQKTGRRLRTGKGCFKPEVIRRSPNGIEDACKGNKGRGRKPYLRGRRLHTLEEVLQEKRKNAKKLKKMKRRKPSTPVLAEAAVNNKGGRTKR